jgi:hypothetical protein
MLGGNLYYPLPGPGPTTVDTMVTHPCNPTGLFHHAHTIQGAAAAAACKQKCNASQRDCVRRLSFFAFALASYRHLGTQAMDYIAFASASTGAETYGCFVACVHREISATLIKVNHGVSGRGSIVYSGFGACLCA